MARHGPEETLQSHSPPAMPVARADGSPGQSSPVSPLDSRIPRLAASPSTPLRRSASLRLRGSAANAVGTAFQHHHDFFPAIKENGTETPRRCSSSLSLTPSRRRTHPRAAAAPADCAEDCSDVESLKSCGSNYSTASACDHASFARNGTTWSGRSRRYVFHCNTHSNDNDEYLTPTQRAARQVRELQALLRKARQEIEEKDREIVSLTKEVVELRLYKASLNSPDEKTDSSEAATIREIKPFSPDSPPQELDVEDSAPSPRTPEKKEASLVDSGHFEDGSIHSKESAFLLVTNAHATVPYADTAQLIDDSFASTTSSSLAVPHDDSSNLLCVTSLRDASLHEEDTKRIVDHYERRIEEMHRRHVDEIQLLKQNHNDKVESLLNQLSEMSTRYCETRPSLDAAEARAKELEAEVEALRTELAEQKDLLADQEERNKQMYLKMYSKGQEAARIEQADQVLEQAQKNPSKVSVAELLQQLTSTQAELENIKVMYRRIVESRSNQGGALDPEITLQFLKSAIYYFLTDKENLHGHLNAIESILGFTDSEKLHIDRIYGSARK